MRATIRSLICAAIVLSALCVHGSVARADENTDYIDSIMKNLDYVNQINQSVQQTQDYITQINDAATNGNFSGPGGAAINFSGNLINGGYYYIAPRPDYGYTSPSDWSNQGNWGNSAADAASVTAPGAAAVNAGAFNQAHAARRQPAPALTLREQATALIQQKKYDQAIRLCDQAIALNPKNALAYNERGAAYSWMDQYDQAIENYTQALQLDPASALAWRNRGSMYFHKGEYAKAVADCTEAIRRDSSYASAYLTRNLAYDHLKRDAEAKSEVVAADKSALKHEALSYNEAGAAFSWKDDSTAIESWALAILLVPALALAWRNRGSVLVCKDA